MNSPKTILITGAGSGIGRALATSYAAPDICLFLLGRRRGTLEEVAEDCTKRGAACKIIETDVRDGERMRDVLFQIDAETPLDLVIANAGVTSGLAEAGMPEPWNGVQDMITINFAGVINTVAPMVEKMTDRKTGQIAIMGSLGAGLGLPSSPAYSAAKAGIEAYGMALRYGLAGQNVKVNVISPGYVETDMSRKVTGPKPFLISADKAAKIISRGLARNRARIAFPWPLSWGAAFLSILPAGISHFFLSFFSFTVQRND